MKRVIISTAAVVALLGIAAPAFAQIGGLLRGAQRVREAQQDLTITDDEEYAIGSDVSEMLRDRYGVVQDREIHRYVTLVGQALAARSSRSNLRWTFIVLDTDGVNAFAAPGGFVHITRGALALIDNEAELADVLGHEIGHVTEKHTINAIKKAKGTELAASATRSALMENFANSAYAAIVENKFDRNDEMGSDRVGITLANTVGYSPAGLSAFLTKLSERNKDLAEPSGPFASHPEARARIDALAKLIASSNLNASATVQARFEQHVTYSAVPVSAVPQGDAPAAAAEPEPSGGGGGFGLRNLNPLGRERSSSQTVASAGSRGANPDRDAKGGPNKSLVVVTVSSAEVAEFVKGITG
jgi:predicted Zn-dependent protease